MDIYDYMLNEQDDNEEYINDHDQQTLQMQLIELKFELDKCRRQIDEQFIGSRETMQENYRLKRELEDVTAERDVLREQNEEQNSVISCLKKNAEKTSKKKDVAEKKWGVLSEEKGEQDETVKDMSRLIGILQKDLKQSRNECLKLTSSKTRLTDQNNKLKTHNQALKSENDEMKVKLDLLDSTASRTYRGMMAANNSDRPLAMVKDKMLAPANVVTRRRQMTRRASFSDAPSVRNLQVVEMAQRSSMNMVGVAKTKKSHSFRWRRLSFHRNMTEDKHDQSSA